MRVANHLAVDAADGRHDGQHATDLAAVSWGFDEALDLTGILRRASDKRGDLDATARKSDA